MADPTPGVTQAAAPTPAAAQPATPAPKPTGQPAAAAPAATPKATPAPAAPQPAAAPAQQVPLASLMEERDKRQALQAELDSLKQTVQQIQQRQPAPGFQQQPAQPQIDQRAELEKLWQNDPRKAVQTEIMLATQWMDNVNAQVDGEAAALATKYSDFNTYRDTAMRYVRALPLDQRAKQGIVEMAYLVTRGQSVDQIIEQQRQQLAEQFRTNPASFQIPAGTAAAPTAPVGTVQATDAEVRAAKAMKVDIAEYLKWKK